MLPCKPALSYAGEIAPQGRRNMAYCCSDTRPGARISVVMAMERSAIISNTFSSSDSSER